jgi:hypothetical protein
MSSRKRGHGTLQGRRRSRSGFARAASCGSLQSPFDDGDWIEPEQVRRRWPPGASPSASCGAAWRCDSHRARLPVSG